MLVLNIEVAQPGVELLCQHVPNEFSCNAMVQKVKIAAKCASMLRKGAPQAKCSLMYPLDRLQN